MAETFSQFKSRFYERVNDLSVFDCAEFNLLKVVLDGLKVNYASRGMKDGSVFQSAPVAQAMQAARRFRHYSKVNAAKTGCEAFSKQLGRPYFFFDNARAASTESGEQVSFYFNRIRNYIGPENCVTLYQQASPIAKGTVVKDLVLATLFDAYSADDRRLIAQLKQTYERIAALGVFSSEELLNIRIAINKFFEEYRFWSGLFKHASIKYALFDEHYHREGLILALKRRGIKVIELQHGLIAAEDIFYIFPEKVRPVAERALFPDRIFTYGRYWSSVLERGAEFKPSQIEVLGVYQEINTCIDNAQKKQITDFAGDSPLVLVTTQTFLDPYFVEYVQFLSASLLAANSPAKILVKNHPAEKPEKYEALRQLPNVLLIQANTEYLLSICQWHVSCYSTTLYDAARHRCKNYSLHIEQCSDYVRELVRNGISTLIYKDQNPVTMQSSEAVAKLDASALYEDFEMHKHKLKAL